MKIFALINLLIRIAMRYYYKLKINRWQQVAYPAKGKPHVGSLTAKWIGCILLLRWLQCTNNELKENYD